MGLVEGSGLLLAILACPFSVSDSEGVPMISSAFPLVLSFSWGGIELLLWDSEERMGVLWRES
jgi:hypothetical protein